MNVKTIVDLQSNPSGILTDSEKADGQRALDTAIAEINKKTDFHVEMESLAKGPLCLIIL
jgi:hypothetical protein